MASKFRFPAAILFCLALLFNACQKELSFPNPPVATGTSVYNFAGAPNACTGASISGTYSPSTPLTSSNTVLVSANVLDTGTYVITTAIVNGMSFTASGTFDTTGVQPVLLYGTGTPLAAGTFVFTLGTAGCTFSVTVTSGLPGNSGGTAMYTFNGAPGNCTSAAVTGTYVSGTALDTANKVTIAVNVDSIGTYTISTSTVNGVSFSATGTFATTGPQNIVLTGSGTPAAAGTFSYIPGTAGCAFPVIVTAGAVVADCKACIYVPICQGSTYTYMDTTQGNAVEQFVEYTSVTDTLIDGARYSKLHVTNTPAAVQNDSYTNCSSGITIVKAYNATGVNGSTLDFISTVPLKANEPVGGTWSEVINNPAGQPVTFIYSIVSKGSSRTLGGITYPDVIHVHLSQTMTLPVLGTIELIQSEFYYARGIGLIENISNDVYITNTMLSHRVLKSYFIP